ncbi:MULTISPECIES: tRNA (cytidine(34)-2'-O)-methyltransferase [Desulfococcus]|jgi:tRNA (cytidine/uridine-2'-O-)-methyltransferase|uniref:Putative tRNA (cytidine(34)-2'-O)-methyltransferase n=1 Tax=Desulfococcus multivorans DSM 2059 TaxID=1121405 RepID=S7TGF1_DESML|nr:tRNA (cytidine(34)-2'-O)-methyltransferase [Desulfococcus multivorans]AQV02000.1 tRNA methyltransferase [Desulfococcus multivorans]EPR35836.1 S-adenosyl-L-methionine dependent tRNA/rRNA methyltransferase, SpoU [Desulfococcus multivorans DSM 2059]MDX9818490.1 tRNA (cytidine(34)-2'-O)-methyltransferase [Desulfococcus multivorans]SJZ33925.1 tRNA (cytidine/uridine-2'-O-)-methyltransferase [Desulfococcus multivorans DSM 2059]
MDQSPKAPASPSVERHVVLVAPEVHWNTGNIGRTCLGAGAFLHLVKPLGFSLAEREVKRAGLDYWPRVRLSVWECFEEFLAAAAPSSAEMALFAKKGSRPFWHMTPPQRFFLVFGAETRGLSPDILARYPANTYHIPITREVRCLNLSTSVGIALYESLRTASPFHAWS